MLINWDFQKKNSKYCMWKLMKVNSPEWAYLLFGCVGCIINGGLVPIYAYFYGQVFEVKYILYYKH